MENDAFQAPQRQSAVGIILIFATKAYAFFRGFWGLFAVLIFTEPSDKLMTYSYLGLGVLALFGVVYSLLYYRRFYFHIDYQQEEFVLEEGVFSKTSLRIPFHKIQQVDLKRSLLQQLIGVYSLAIDTAGSGEKEVEIKALSYADAAALSELLTQAKTETRDSSAQTSEESSAERPQTASAAWTYQLSFWTLCKIGLTRSYFRGFILTAAFVSSLFNEGPSFLQQYFDDSKQYLEANYSALIDTVFVVILAVVVVFVVSALVTIGEVILKHYNLKMRQVGRHLEVEMGLKTHTKVSFQPRRLQRLRLKTNPIQKRLDLYEVQFSLAGSADVLDKSKLVVPGLGQDLVDKIKSFLYPDEPTEKGRVFRPHQLWLWRRLHLVFWPLLLIWTVDYTVPSWDGMPYLVGLSVCFFLIYLPYQFLLYKRFRICFTKDFLVLNHGLWSQEQEVIELYKLQGVSVRQPLWYKRRKLYNLTFHTAGGDVSVRAMPKAVKDEVNRLLYKIEATQKPWM